MGSKLKENEYRLFWYEDDQEWVAKVVEGEYKGLSWLEPDPIDAMRGLLKLVKEIEQEDK